MSASHSFHFILEELLILLILTQYYIYESHMDNKIQFKVGWDQEDLS